MNILIRSLVTLYALRGVLRFVEGVVDFGPPPGPTRFRGGRGKVYDLQPGRPILCPFREFLLFPLVTALERKSVVRRVTRGLSRCKF
jgi:hypothetical protein